MIVSPGHVLIARMSLQSEELDPQAAEKLTYEPPEMHVVGSFRDVTQGAGGSLAFDFYLTDRP
jgi:hypothetical protein